MVRKKGRAVGSFEPLEGRIVLSPAAFRPIGGRHVLVPMRPPATIVTRINGAFAQFSANFKEVRAIYRASASTPAFKAYVDQRVEVLAQQVATELLRSPAQSGHKSSRPSPIPSIVARIDGRKPGVTSLAKDLEAALPKAGDDAQSIALIELAQDGAIEAARTSVINRFNVAKAASVQNGKSHH